jgi:hypothetical protein
MNKSFNEFIEKEAAADEDEYMKAAGFLRLEQRREDKQ